MKRLAAVATTFAVLAMAAAFSLSGAATNKAPTGGDLQIDIEGRNPWTNLQLNNDRNNFQFAIVTDRTGGHRPGIFPKAVEKLNLLQPEFVLSVGDLIQGGSEDPGQWALEWSEFEAKLDKLEMPFFFCPGNHDISNVPMSNEWKRKFGRTYYEFRYKDVLFVVLNSEDDRTRIGEGRPYNFTETQAAWLREVLAQNCDVRWTFVFFHKPAWSYNNVEQENACGWTPIEAALQGRPYTVFAGHRHNYAKYVRHGRDYYMLATTGGGSKLRGFSKGEFDHFVWVTMKESGPVVANVLLDGIQNKDIRTLEAGQEPE